MRGGVVKLHVRVKKLSKINQKLCQVATVALFAINVFLLSLLLVCFIVAPVGETVVGL